jgi:hypothetical protein
MGDSPWWFRRLTMRANELGAHHTVNTDPALSPQLR